MKKTIIIVLVCLLALGLSACSFSIGALYPDGEKYTAGDAVITDKVETLLVDWSSGSVTIEPGDGDAIELCETGNKPVKAEEQMQYYLDGTTLHVRFCAPGKLTVGIMPEKNLHVTLPKDLVLRELDVSTASAALNVTDLRAERMKLGTASGEVSGSVAYAGELRIGTASGEVKLATPGEVGTIDADTASGDIELTTSGEVGTIKTDTASGAVSITAESVRELDMESASGRQDVVLAKMPQECEMDSASGEVTLTLPADAEFTAEVDTASGDFDCEFPTVLHGDTYICGGGGAELSFDTASGDISILKKD